MSKLMLDHLNHLLDLHYDVIPVGVDGPEGFNLKNPGIVPNWYEYVWTQDEAEDVLREDTRRGLGLRLSAAGLIDIETDTEEASIVAEELFGLCDELPEAPPAWHRVDRENESHFPGVHRLFRLTESQVQTLSEFRKLGGFKTPGGIEVRTRGQSVLPPAGGREWLLLPCPMERVPYLPDSIFEKLTAHLERPAEREGGDGMTDSPGYDFCRRAEWKDILTPHGWKVSGKHATRPGKSYGVSATIGVLTSETRGDLLYVFSEDPAVSPLQPHATYSKFEAYATLFHDGDFSEAARQLRREGYGVTRSAESMFEPLDVTDADIPISQVSTSGLVPLPLEEHEKPKPQVFARLEDRYYDNPVGEFCIDLREYTNIDLQATYFQALEMVGALCGRNVYYKYNLKPRYAVDNLIVTGVTGSGKGSTFDAAKILFKPEDSDNLFQNGNYFEQAYLAINRGRFGSSEGLIQELASRDAAREIDGFQLGSQYCGTLLLTDQEASAAFTKMFYDTSVLNESFRQIWDFNTLSNTTKSATSVAKNPLVGLIWHIVPMDIAKLPSHLIHGGLINRMKIIECRKPENPPCIEPGIDLERHKERVFAALQPVADNRREWVFTPAAREVLKAVALQQHELEGLVASTHERYTAHVERQAVRLAVLKGRDGIITEADVDAAWAMQEIVFRHTETILEDMRGLDWDASLEARIIEYVAGSVAPPSKSDITRYVLGNHTEKIPARDRVLNRLVANGTLVRGGRPQRTGRPAEVYWLP